VGVVTGIGVTAGAAVGRGEGTAPGEGRPEVGVVARVPPFGVERQVVKAASVANTSTTAAAETFLIERPTSKAR
jgi:hypothetical protein